MRNSQDAKICLQLKLRRFKSRLEIPQTASREPMFTDERKSIESLTTLQESQPHPGQVRYRSEHYKVEQLQQLSTLSPKLCSFPQLNYRSYHWSGYRLINFILKRQIDPSVPWVALQMSPLGLPRQTDNRQKPIDWCTLSCPGSCRGLSGLKTVCPGIPGTLISDQIVSISFPLLVTVWLQLTRLQSPKAVTDIWIKILQDF